MNAALWDRVDELAGRAPTLRDLRFHGLQLVAARRLAREGRPVPHELRDEQRLAAVRSLVVRDVLERVRDALPGDVLLMKGPEAAARWQAPAARPFCDLDLLVDDAEAAQSVLLRAGFRQTDEPRHYREHHHVCPLRLPGLPLAVEVHRAPHWPDGMTAPSTAELLARAVPSATGVDGIGAPDAAAHALLLAAHAWAHGPLAGLRHVVDVVAVAAEAEMSQVEALADRWDCARLWRTSAAAAGAVLLGGGRTLATRTWGRGLAGVRERTVLEQHLQRGIAPLWAMAPAAGGAAAAAHWRSLARRPDGEPWGAKLRRTAAAFRDARKAQSLHDARVPHPPTIRERETA